jgi:hypothetical protein
MAQPRHCALQHGAECYMDFVNLLWNHVFVDLTEGLDLQPKLLNHIDWNLELDRMDSFTDFLVISTYVWILLGDSALRVI